MVTCLHVYCDAHDARVSVLHEVCVCRVTVLYVTCIYVSYFQDFVCARYDHVLMCDGVVPRHCARCSCVWCLLKMGFIIALSVISN